MKKYRARYRKKNCNPFSPHGCPHTAFIDVEFPNKTPIEKVRKMAKAAITKRKDLKGYELIEVVRWRHL